MGLFDWFKKKDVLTDNGENQTFHKKGKELKEIYKTENGKRHGKYESFYKMTGENYLSANYKEGKLDGECKSWSCINAMGGGGCYRYIELYDNGELRNREIYTCGPSEPIDPVTQTRKLVKKEKFSKGNSEIGFIAQDIDFNKNK